jgi:hypothetical protein
VPTGSVVGNTAPRRCLANIATHPPTDGPWFLWHWSAPSWGGVFLGANNQTTNPLRQQIGGRNLHANVDGVAGH